jgi:hypothetical protein
MWHTRFLVRPLVLHWNAPIPFPAQSVVVEFKSSLPPVVGFIPFDRLLHPILEYPFSPGPEPQLSKIEMKTLAEKLAAITTS